MILSVLDFEQNMVLVACGPYTTSDSITYDPLLDLIAIINRDRPDVCILVGNPPGTASPRRAEGGGRVPMGKLGKRLWEKAQCCRRQPPSIQGHSRAPPPHLLPVPGSTRSPEGQIDRSWAENH